MYCWGDNRFGQLGYDRGDKLVPHQVTSPQPTGWRDVDLGEHHTCALRNDNEIYCWGSNQALRSLISNGYLSPAWEKGQLGSRIVDDTGPAREHVTQRFADTPQAIASIGALQPPPYNAATDLQEDWTHNPQWLGLDVFSFGNGSVAWQQDEDVYAWGNNRNAVLGIGPGRGIQSNCVDSAAKQISGPYEVVPVDTWAQIRLGKSHSCAKGSTGLRGGSDLYCWGANQSGQLGTGQTTGACHSRPRSDRVISSDPTGPLATTDIWIDVVTGMDFTCATDINSQLQCWGGNEHGQLGLGHFHNVYSPQLLSADHYFSVGAGAKHACAIIDNGDLVCWGSNRFGQTGTSSSANVTRPLAVILPPSLGTVDWHGFDAGAFHNCGIIDDQIDYSLWCWGSNRAGQLGNGNQQDQRIPQKVAPDQQWNLVAGGTDHTCGITADGHLYCWGSNQYGKLGHGEDNIWFSAPTELQ